MRERERVKKADFVFFFLQVCTSDAVCDSLVPTGQNGTCYRGGLAVYENHQMCDVTSKKFSSNM